MLGERTFKRDPGTLRHVPVDDDVDEAKLTSTIMRLHDEGRAIREIAEQLGVKKYQVEKRLK